jgi:glutathione synthase/RimK-type ligase-like ATP-grasp enzyme
MRQIEKIIADICTEEKWSYQYFAEGWLIKVQNQWVYGYHFGLNAASADRLCDDKSATYEVLSVAGLPAVEHLFLTQENLDLPALLTRLSAGNLVIKPNAGTGGRHVCRVTTEAELSDKLASLFSQEERLAVSPFEEIVTEYRVIVLDGQLELLYAKHLTAESGWKFNLGQGARAELLSGDRELEKLALATTQVLGLRFASVDICQLADGDRKVLEVNSGLMMEKFSQLSSEHYARAKAIYKKALKKALES